jgi:hypothetical protein
MMQSRTYPRSRRSVARWGTLAALACLALLVPSSAGAATVVNGDFETGTLGGWQVQNYPAYPPPPPESNSWFAYSETTAPTSGNPIPTPPQGSFAAISDQGGQGTHVLYQDIALEPYYAHKLSLTAYYHTYAPIAIPTPDTLNFTGGPSETTFEQPNQQYRIDVMKPTAPILSINPADILATVFATKVGSPEEMAPTQLTADLSAFAGQTVRLRFVEVDNQFFFNAGVDAVGIASTPPSNAFSLGKATRDRKKGTATVPIVVPGAGVLTATDAKLALPSASASKAAKPLVKSATLTATAAGTLNLVIKPTKAARKVLKRKHKVKVKVLVSFTPTGGLVASQSLSLVLQMKRKHKPHK